MIENCAVESTLPRASFEVDLGGYCKALSHPARIRLLKVLIQKGSCVTGDLADELPLAPSTVSEHLRILKESGLVTGTIDGPRRCYCVNDRAIEYLKSLMTELFSGQESNV